MGMKLQASWHQELKEELSLPYIAELKAFLEKEKAAGAEIYPPEGLVFNAFLHTPYEKVRVVIMGQDPYHGLGQAHGLSFSVPPGVEQPPSLKNMIKELMGDCKITPTKNGCLTSWADQGVLLLNATLTVRSGEAKSHYGRGWEKFTDAVIAKLWQREDPIVFVLWGRSAQEKVQSILQHSKRTHHAVLTAAHPSPLSAHNGFLGCGHFSKINAYLKQWGQKEIEWQI
jgi:uracil-DNA glycosylase